MYTSINPANGQVLGQHVAHDARWLEDCLDRAVALQGNWASRPLEERLELVEQVGKRLREEAGDLARLMALEMGKPLAQGRAEAEKCAWVCDYYVEKAAAQLSPIEIPTESLKSRIVFEPLGLVLAIMPWNFPLWQVIRVVIPALVVGNGVVIKHAPNTFGSSDRLVRLLEDAGMPAGLVGSVHLDPRAVGTLIADRRIAAVTLTGSNAAGRAVAEQAGRHLKKCVLELGGSDANIVLADADIQLAADTCVTSRMINNGQSCIAAKRLIAVKPVYHEFLSAVKERMAAYDFADPLDDSCRLGPVAREDLRDNLHNQVMASVSRGAIIELGGKVPVGPGWWYPATVLSAVSPGMPAFDEELFGPVASVIQAEDEEDALRLAELSPYGLGGAIFSRDTDHAEELARHRLSCGSAFVNGLVRSDPRLPFGGVKDSGFGRELSAFGLREFVNIKTLVVDR